MLGGGSEKKVGGASAFADLSDVDTTGLQTGQAMVWNGAVWVPGSSSSGREVLTADRTYYVRTDGSDSNDGLTDTAGGAFLTIQKAYNVAKALDQSIYSIFINIADGTYNGQLSFSGIVPGNNLIAFVGNTTNPENCIIIFSPTGNYRALVNVANGASISFEGITLNADALYTGTRGVSVQDAGSKISFKNCRFGDFIGENLARENGAVFFTSTIQIDGASAKRSFMACQAKGVVYGASATFTLTNTPPYSRSFIDCPGGYVEFLNSSFSGSATGERYDVQENGVVKTNGGGATFFPGSVAGTVATGGQYI